jgi:hypothetical protein
MPLPPFLLLPVCSRVGYQAGRLVRGPTGRPALFIFWPWTRLPVIRNFS